MKKLRIGKQKIRMKGARGERKRKPQIDKTLIWKTTNVKERCKKRKSKTHNKTENVKRYKMRVTGVKLEINSQTQGEKIECKDKNLKERGKKEKKE